MTDVTSASNGAGLAMGSTWQPERAVDLVRYPILDLEQPAARALLESCRAELAESGALVLEGFLFPQAARQAIAELDGLLDNAFYCEKQHNPYLDPQDPALPADHPRNRLQVSDVGALADDQIPRGSILQSLYHWDRLQAFVATLLGVPRLYPYADPLGSLNLSIYQPGQQIGWHYDNADWAVTLMLQPAEAAGAYEYGPRVRDGARENYDRVAKILDGDRDGVRRLSQDVGALVLFRGRHSIHRVTPVEGGRPRLIAILSYDTEPGVMLTEHYRRLFFGRVA